MSLLSYFRNLFNSSKVKEDPLHSTAKETIHYTVSLDQVPKQERTPEARSIYRKKLARKEYRLNRNRLIWAIERHFVEYNVLCHTDNIYDFRKSWHCREVCAKTLSEFNPTKNDFVFAYRLIRIKYAEGECVDYDGDLPELTKDIVDQVFNIDKVTLLNDMYDRMKIYWDEVVGAYHNDSTKKYRNEYLINRLTEEKQMPLVADCPEIIQKIDKLIEHYSNF